MSHRSHVAVRRLLAALMVLASLAAIAPAGIATAQSDRGLIDETSYQSPQFGYSVTWAEPWSVEDRDVISNPGGFDTLSIRSDAGTVRISGRSDDYNAVTFLLDTIAIQEASGGVVINQDTTAEVPFAEMQVGLERMRFEVVSLPDVGAIVLLSLRAAEGDYDAALASAREGIQLNGTGIFGSLPTGAATPEPPAEGDTAAAPVESTVVVQGSGVEGNAYTSPNFGFNVSWDETVWTVVPDAEDSVPGYDIFALESATGPMVVIGWEGYAGNAATCLAGEQTYRSDPDEGISDWQVATDANGVELTESSPDVAWGVFTNVFTDPEDPAAPPTDYVDYIRCVSLGDGKSVVIFWSYAERDVYNDHIGNVISLVDSLQLPAAAETPTAPAQTPTLPPTTPTATTAATTPTATETATAPTTPTATEAGTTPTTPTSPTTPATGGQPVTVGQTQVTWTGDWELDEASSVAEQITLSQIDVTTGDFKLATYGEFLDPTVSTPDAALDAFVNAFFASAGATDQSVVNSGTLPTGEVWRLYAFTLNGIPLNLLISVGQNPSGAYVVSTITGDAETFPETIAQAQQEILLNGQPTFMQGIDAQTAVPPVTTTPTATTPAETPTAAVETPGTTPTAGASPTSTTGLGPGDTVTGQTYAYSFTIPAGWHVNESSLGGAVERTVLTNGTSTVAIEARAMTAPTLSDCIANVAGEHQSQAVYTDLELARTASGDPFTGEDEFTAFANFTFTGSDGETWAHFIECRWIVPGESVLVVTQDVQQDQFGSERAARRQIQNTIEVGQ